MIRVLSVSGTQINISPLVLLLILACLVFNMWQVVLVAFLSLVLHELCHTLMAKKLGISVVSVDILPIGFTAVLDCADPAPSDEFKIALCGPVYSLVAGCVAAYVKNILPYHAQSILLDEFVMINISIGLINLLPALPLDGGRMLSSLLQGICTPRNAKLICIFIGIGISALSIAAGIYLLLENAVNLTLPIFGIFLLLASIREFLQLRSVQAAAMLRRFDTIRRGRALRVSTLALSNELSANTALTMLNTNCYNVIFVVDARFCTIGRIDEEQLFSAIAKRCDITLGEILESQSNIMC